VGVLGVCAVGAGSGFLLTTNVSTAVATRGSGAFTVVISVCLPPSLQQSSPSFLSADAHCLCAVTSTLHSPSMPPVRLHAILQAKSRNCR
jgi:hypothetical protein